MGDAISSHDMSSTDGPIGSYIQARSSEVAQLDCLVFLQIYDPRPWLETVNTLAKPLGWGAFHVGVEVFGEEWAFSADGVHRHTPCKHPAGYAHRDTVDMGSTPVDLPKWRKLCRQLNKSWPRRSYHLLKKNCVSFACEVCRCLEVPVEVPRWVLGAAAMLEASPKLQAALMAGITGQHEVITKQQLNTPLSGTKNRQQPAAIRCRPTRSHSEIFQKGRPNDSAWVDRSVSGEDCFACVRNTLVSPGACNISEDPGTSDGFFSKGISDRCAHSVSLVGEEDLRCLGGCSDVGERHMVIATL